MSRFTRTYFSLSTLSVIALASACSLGQSQGTVEAKSARVSVQSDKDDQLKDLVTTLNGHFMQNNVSSLDSVMSPKAREAFYLQLLFSARQFVVSNSQNADKDQVAELTNVLRDTGYDKIDLDIVGSGATVKQMRQREREIYAALGNAEKRISAATRMLSILNRQSSINPFFGSITDIQMTEKSAFVMLTDPLFLKTQTDKNEVQETSGVSLGEVKPVRQVLRFVRSKNDWVYDGPDEDLYYELQDEFNQQLFRDVRLQGVAVDGSKIQLADYRGKFVLIDFWGTWCRPCVAELPRLKMIHKALKSHGFEIIGVAVDDKNALEKFSEKRPLPWKSIVDEQGSIAKRFFVDAYPTTLLIDPAGKHIGRDLAGKQLLDELLNRMSLPAVDFEDLAKRLEAGDH